MITNYIYLLYCLVDNNFVVHERCQIVYDLLAGDGNRLFFYIVLREKYFSLRFKVVKI